jgi:hypothetical protein
MLGPPKERNLDRSVLVSLERLVPADHFYRHLDATLDLSFIRDWVVDLYASAGRPSIDPVDFFKFQLVMFFEGIRSERKLMEHATLNLAHRWYLGVRRVGAYTIPSQRAGVRVDTSSNKERRRTGAMTPEVNDLPGGEN